jgi:hypothetical protein
MSKFMLRRLGLAGDYGHVQPTLQACLEAVLEQSDSLMDDVLLGLAATLLPLQGQKSTTPPSRQARQAIERLGEQAAAVKQAFSAHLRKIVFGGDASRQSAGQVMHFDDFQFLDADQIDANIEIAQSQQTVLMAVQDSLPTVHAMVSHLMGWSSVQGHLNPLKPEAFVQALRTTLEELVPDRAARATVVALASGLLGVSLHSLYREMADWLRSQGVEPVHMASSASTSLWNPADARQGTVARTMLTLDKLRRLLSGELDPNPVAADAMDFAHTIPASLEALQEMKLVEPMMKRLSERAGRAREAARPVAGSAAPVVDMLAQQADQADRRQMGVQLGKEVVLLMLDNLLRDRRLLPPVRASLQTLEPVLVRLSQQDGRFFSERQHPARLFLDRMTHRSLAFASEDAPGFARFQKYFDNAVSVLTGGAGDAAAFSRVLRKLEEAWAKEEATQHQRASDAARGLLRAEQRNLLAQRLSQQFAQRLVGMKVPEVVRAFVCGPWAQVAAEAQLHFADGSVDPGGYLALVDELLWSVQLRLIRHNRARLVQSVPDMLVTMRHGLELIAYPQQRMAAFFDALISFHEQVFDSDGAVAQVVPEAALASASRDAQTSAAGSIWVVPSEVSDSGYMDANALQPAAASTPLQSAGPDRRVWSVDGLSIGCWVDLAVNGQWLRAQLTWASPQRTLFLFIAGAGSTHSVSRQTLEQMKAAGLVRMVSASRVLDNALDAVARTALNNDLHPETPPKALE